MKFLETITHAPNFLPYNSNVCLYGIGDAGKRFKSLLERYRKDIRIVFWVDSFKSGTQDGLEIVNVDSLTDFKKDSFDFVLIVSVFWKEMEEKLKTLHIDNYMIVDLENFPLEDEDDYYHFNLKNFSKMRKEIDVLYSVFYHLAHDLDESMTFFANQTRHAFGYQWENLKTGDYLLSDPWFKENVDRILWEEEIQIDSSWFKGKNILDVGCGNGRWSYGFAKLGANVTAVDVNEVAILETQKTLEPFNVKKNFYVSTAENLTHVLPSIKYDLVFSWGVLHHSKCFNKALKETVKFVKDDGMLYLYLYGQESRTHETEFELFKERLRYNTMLDEKERYNFLFKKAKGNLSHIHKYHDGYSPLINRRMNFSYIKEFLEKEGFEDIVRTIDHTELFIRAIKSNKDQYYKNWILPKKPRPYWFKHHQESIVNENE